MSEDSVCANLEHTADEHGYPFFRQWLEQQREPLEDDEPVVRRGRKRRGNASATAAQPSPFVIDRLTERELKQTLNERTEK